MNTYEVVMLYTCRETYQVTAVNEDEAIKEVLEEEAGDPKESQDIKFDFQEVTQVQGTNTGGK